MVTKMLILFCALFLPDGNYLFVMENCPPCIEAEKIVPSDTEIISSARQLRKYNIWSTPTYVVIKNGRVIKRVTGLKNIKEHFTRFGAFTGVIYFDGPQDILTSTILKRIKRFGFTIRNGTKQERIDYKITHLPTFIFVKNGNVLGRYVGTTPC